MVLVRTRGHDQKIGLSIKAYLIDQNIQRKDESDASNSSSELTESAEKNNG